MQPSDPGTRLGTGSDTLNASSSVAGHAIRGKVWGCGAGSTPSGYGVGRIGGPNPGLVMAPAIMAGFLAIAPRECAERQQIAAQLEWMREQRVCASEMPLPDGRAPTILWRCSADEPDWRPGGVDSIDFATGVLGLAADAIPPGFYETYAA